MNILDDLPPVEPIYNPLAPWETHDSPSMRAVRRLEAVAIRAAEHRYHYRIAKLLIENQRLMTWFARARSERSRLIREVAKVAKLERELAILRKPASGWRGFIRRLL